MHTVLMIGQFKATLADHEVLTLPALCWITSNRIIMNSPIITKLNQLFKGLKKNNNRGTVSKSTQLTDVIVLFDSAETISPNTPPKSATSDKVIPEERKPWLPTELPICPKE